MIWSNVPPFIHQMVQPMKGELLFSTWRTLWNKENEVEFFHKEDFTDYHSRVLLCVRDLKQYNLTWLLCVWNRYQMYGSQHEIFIYLVSFRFITFISSKKSMVDMFNTTPVSANRYRLTMISILWHNMIY